MESRKVLIFGAGGRVGQQISAELLANGLSVVMVDLLDDAALSSRAGRLRIDTRLARGEPSGALSVHGGINVLDRDALLRVLQQEQPDLVINYAIPITWDATKQLPNYSAVSAAGLGAFTPIQVLSPLRVAEALAELGLKVPFMVGNLPDITVPILAGMASGGAVARPVCGAGNVGLIQLAIREVAARELQCDIDAVCVHLVAHHIHWVAPREPGYRDDAPFMLQIIKDGADVTDSLGDARAFMNGAINRCYEDGAAFSSTTGLLAARVAMGLLEPDTAPEQLHVPAPLGLPGGYPVSVSAGGLALALPEGWSTDAAVKAMSQAQQRDGVAQIEDDGTVHFSEEARQILRAELDLPLPERMTPADIPAVANDQISALRARFS